MNNAQFTLIILSIVKIGGIIFALSHALVGLLLFRQITRMRKVISASGTGLVSFLTLLHIVLLTVVLVLIILLPVS